MRRFKAPVVALLGAVISLPLAAQDYMALRINEIVTANRTTPPADFLGGDPDMVEIYNTSGDLVSLDGLALSDRATLLETPSGPHIWEFPQGVRVPSGGSIVVFCDNDRNIQLCTELHASIRLSDDGDEPLSLWGPEVDGDRVLIDQVFQPPLREDVSFGRYPDGAGDAPVPVEATFETFFYHAPGAATFGECFTTTPSGCPGGAPKRVCFGEANTPGTNLDPRVSRRSQSTNAPAGGEPLEFIVRVRDDKEPTPPNIAVVEIVYRVNVGLSRGEWLTTGMVFRTDFGLDEGGEPDGAGVYTGAASGRLTDRWTIWTGSVPAQEEGAWVEFYFRVEDQEGLTSTRPLDLCHILLEREPGEGFCDRWGVPDASSIGPCDREFGGPGCLLDPCVFEQYIACDTPLSFAVGYVPPSDGPRGDLSAVVINEVVPAQRHDPTNALDPATGILRDPTAIDGELCTALETPPKYCCRASDSPTCGYNDYIELFNGSAGEVDLSGLWLSDSFFNARIWQIPDGVRIGAGQYILIWCDDDGGKCPDISRAIDGQAPEFWECPDPNAVFERTGQLHTTFELNSDVDQIFLLDTEENGFGLIHGVAFRETEPNEFENLSLSLCPDGDRTGTHVAAPATPESPNEATCPPPVRFLRGDSNNDDAVNISDGRWTLNWLFLGGPAPVCLLAADMNDDGSADVADPSFTFNFLFLGGPSPSAPYPMCGVDPESSQTSCEESRCNAAQ